MTNNESQATTGSYFPLFEHVLLIYLETESPLNRSNSFDLVIYVGLYIDYSIYQFFITILLSLDLHKLCHFGTKFHVHNMNCIPVGYLCLYTFNHSRFLMMDSLFLVKVSAVVCILARGFYFFNFYFFVPQRLVVTMEKRSAPWDITLRLP